jgi:hypothetical protein
VRISSYTLLALYTIDTRAHAAPSARLEIRRNVRTLVLEVGDLDRAYTDADGIRHLTVQIISRGRELRETKQRFARSTDAGHRKQSFVDALAVERAVGDDGLVVICGETNICTTVRSTRAIGDPFDFGSALVRLRTRTILNPIHNYMRRPEMKKKRQHYSGAGRTVVSVWNLGEGHEAQVPWTVFHDGLEATSPWLRRRCCFHSSVLTCGSGSLISARCASDTARRARRAGRRRPRADTGATRETLAQDLNPRLPSRRAAPTSECSAHATRVDLDQLPPRIPQLPTALLEHRFADRPPRLLALLLIHRVPRGGLLPRHPMHTHAA